MRFHLVLCEQATNLSCGFDAAIDKMFIYEATELYIRRRVCNYRNAAMFVCPPVRILIATAVLATVPLVRCEPNCDRDPDAQVLILGAGLAGLGAGQKLSERGITDFIILEQSDRVGGRVQSTEFAGTTVQLGPQWVFDVDQTVPEERQQPLWPLIQKCNVSVRDPPLRGYPFVYYTSLGKNITQSPELLSARQKYAASTSPEAVARVLAGLREGQDLTVAAGLRETGWSPNSDPIEELVEFLAHDLLDSRPTDTGSYRDAFDPERILASICLPLVETYNSLSLLDLTLISQTVLLMSFLF